MPVGAAQVTSGYLSGPTSGGSTAGQPAFYENLVLFYPFRNSVADSMGGAAASVSRSTTGNYRTSDHTEASANAGVARLEYKGILSESAATNYILYSTDLTNGAWTASNVTVTSGQADPAGGTDAFKLEATATGVAYLQQIVGTPGRSVGFWLKRGNITSTDTDILLSTVSVSNRDVALPSEWEYITQSSGSTIDELRLYIGDKTTGATAGDYFYVYNPQLQSTHGCTSTITTTTPAATRNLESITIDHTNVPASTADQTWVMEIDAISVGLSVALMALTGETSPRQFVLTNTGVLRATWGGATVSSGAGAAVDGGRYKLVLTKTTGAFYFYVNGTLIGSGTPGATAGTITAMQVGGAGSFRIRDVKVYDRYFTSDEVAYA